MEKKISFSDKKRNRVELEEITRHNSIPDFIISGNMGNSSGPIIAEIKLGNKYQARLMRLWRKYHLTNISTIHNFVDNLKGVVDCIESEERRTESRYVTQEDHELFIGFDEQDTCHALAIMTELRIDEIDDIEEKGDCMYTVQGVDYLCGTDQEMDDKLDDELECIIDDCILPEMPESTQQYFDREKWKKDAKQDSRSHIINKYDGKELRETINGITYFAYRQ